MEKIDKFELMLMDSPINILELPDGVCTSILELMNKCYTTSNEEVVAMIEGRIAELEQLRLTGVSGSDFEIVCTIRIQDLTDLLTKLKQPNNK